MLVQYFDEEVRDALLNNQLYCIDAYGWKDADTPDPAYNGYASWHLNPKVEFDFESYWDERPFDVRPEDNDIQMMLNGYDFLEVMKAVWLHIGQSLFFQKHSDGSSELEFTYSSLSLMSAISELNMASDRIRDYYVLAIANETHSRFIKRKNAGVSNIRAYTAIYEFALNHEKSNLLSEKIKKANELASSIGKKRKYRNNLIHKMASNNAVLQTKFLKQQQRLHDEQRATTDLAPKITENEMDGQMINDKLEFVKEWYLELIELGNLVFELELYSRKFSNGEFS